MSGRMWVVSDKFSQVTELLACAGEEVLVVHDELARLRHVDAFHPWEDDLHGLEPPHEVLTVGLSAPMFPPAGWEGVPFNAVSPSDVEGEVRKRRA